jgi:hypothetical protein
MQNAGKNFERATASGAWRKLRPITRTLTSPTIAARAWTAWKHANVDHGLQASDLTEEGRSLCFCGAEIDIASMAEPVTAAHMIETVDG